MQPEMCVTMRPPACRCSGSGGNRFHLNEGAAILAEDARSNCGLGSPAAVALSQPHRRRRWQGQTSLYAVQFSTLLARRDQPKRKTTTDFTDSTDKTGMKRALLLEDLAKRCQR